MLKALYSFVSFHMPIKNATCKSLHLEFYHPLPNIHSWVNEHLDNSKDDLFANTSQLVIVQWYFKVEQSPPKTYGGVFKPFIQRSCFDVCQ
jgi:hypothetical protein